MNPDVLRTVKVDPETMETLARKSLLDGPPATVTQDEPTYHTKAAIICLVLAFLTGGFFGHPQNHEPPPLPPPQRAIVVPVTLRAVELETPRQEAPRLLHRQKKTTRRDPWMSKPLFERKN